ncbi:hypothetical protein LAZ67_7002788 [Cordylochernes scorpioides]|uniref:Uncharacterized protein n=1 Tax=Cordylochernes scorpioides TaxID=51811 RepID=A0ABY6KNE1_9ARAC|nr:hypothetical protein LAZ67_7002788 [Cordylochernes scorpioides]
MMDHLTPLLNTETLELKRNQLVDVILVHFLQQKLSENLRTYPVAITADIEKMYRQIRIHPEDADYQRILWRPSPEEPVVDYRLLTSDQKVRVAQVRAATGDYLRPITKLAPLPFKSEPGFSGQGEYAENTEASRKRRTALGARTKRLGNSNICGSAIRRWTFRRHRGNVPRQSVAEIIIYSNDLGADILHCNPKMEFENDNSRHDIGVLSLKMVTEVNIQAENPEASLKRRTALGARTKRLGNSNICGSAIRRWTFRRHRGNVLRQYRPARHQIFNRMRL